MKKMTATKKHPLVLLENQIKIVVCTPGYDIRLTL